MLISNETLRVIHLVARHQSITTAAEQLSKVPSAISYAIRKMGKSLDIELFIRKGHYIELSPAGSHLIEYSRTIPDDLETLERSTVLIHDGIERELTIAVNNIIPGDLLAAFIRDFERQFASTTPAVDLGVYDGYRGALYNKRADLVCGAPHAVSSSEGIISEPVGQMEWDFVVNPLHPLAAKWHPLENSELRHYLAVCIRDTSTNFPPMRAQLLEGQGPIFVSNFATAVALIERGVGIGYVPHHLALPLLNSGRLLKKPIRKHKHATKLFLAARSDGMGKTCQWCIEYLGDPQLTTQFMFD